MFTENIVTENWTYSSFCMAELDSLQQHYPDQMEIEDGMLLCHTQKVSRTRYVTLPVVLLIRMNFMSIASTDSLP